MHRLISVFVVRCLDSTIYVIAVFKVSRLELAPEAEQVSLSLNLVANPEDRFSHDVALSYLGISFAASLKNIFRI